MSCNQGRVMIYAWFHTQKKRCTVVKRKDFVTLWLFPSSVIWSDWRWLQARHKLESWLQTSQPKRWCKTDSSRTWSCQTTEVYLNLRLIACWVEDCFDGALFWAVISLLCDYTIYWIHINLHYWRLNESACNYHSCIVTWQTRWPYLFSLPLVQGNMLSFSSIPWTSPSCVQLRSSLSVMLPKISGRSAVRSSPPLLTHTSPTSHGSYKALCFEWLCGFTLANSSRFLFGSCPRRTNTPRKQGGLGAMKIPLVSDTRRTISTDYGVLKEDEGIAYRWV